TASARPRATRSRPARRPPPAGASTMRSPPSLAAWCSRMALSILAVALGTQCSSRFETYCENQRACRGGNDKDVEACIEGARAEENIAAAYDCEEPFDAVAKCLETAPCRDRRLDTS